MCVSSVTVGARESFKSLRTKVAMDSTTIHASERGPPTTPQPHGAATLGVRGL